MTITKAWFIETTDYDDVLVSINIDNFFEEDTMTYEQQVNKWFDDCEAITQTYCKEHNTNIVPLDVLPTFPQQQLELFTTEDQLLEDISY